MNNGYSSYGGIVGGQGNRIDGAFASVLSGHYNIASGEYSSVSGGHNVDESDNMGNNPQKITDQYDWGAGNLYNP